jgi:hypothetical protein
MFKYLEAKIQGKGERISPKHITSPTSNKTMKSIVIIDIWQRKSENLCENRVYISCPVTKKVNYKSQNKRDKNI